jgi:hypothetical protein
VEDVDRKILELAGRQYRREGVREQAMSEQLGLTPTLFWLRVNRLIDDPAAMLEYPTLTARLRRLRDQRQVQRRSA